MRNDIETLKKDVVLLKTDSAVLKWMAGFNLAMVVAILGLLPRGLH